MTLPPTSNPARRRWTFDWTDAVFAFAVANAVVVAGLALFPDSRAAHAAGLHALDAK